MDVEFSRSKVMDKSEESRSDVRSVGKLPYACEGEEAYACEKEEQEEHIAGFNSFTTLSLRSPAREDLEEGPLPKKMNNPTEILSLFDEASSFLYDQFYAAGSKGGILADGTVSQLAKDIYAGRISRKEFMEEEARDRKSRKELVYDEEDDEEFDEEVDDYDPNEEEKWDWD